MTKSERRIYQRLYARRRRAQRLTLARRTRQHCPRRLGRFECGGILEASVLRDGTVALACPRCELLEAGLCLNCRRPVDGAPRKARWCAVCRKAAARASMRRYRAEHAVLVRRRAREYARRHRAQNADYKRLWRAANPEKVAAQKRRYSLRQPQVAYAYQREYRQTHLPVRQAIRRCLAGCGAVVTGRVKKCAACKDAIRASALRMLGRVAA